MTRAQPPKKPAKVWEPAEWLLALQDGEAQRLQARFEKEAATSKPRRPPETPSEQRARFEAEFLKAKEQREVQELRKVAKKRPAAEAEPVADPAKVHSFLVELRRAINEGLLLSAAMARAHGLAKHSTSGGKCVLCADVAFGLVNVLGDASLFPIARGQTALDAIDKAVIMTRSRGVHIAPQVAPAKPLHDLSTDQVLTALGLGSQPPADA